MKRIGFAAAVFATMFAGAGFAQINHTINFTMPIVKLIDAPANGDQTATLTMASGPAAGAGVQYDWAGGEFATDLAYYDITNNTITGNLRARLTNGGSSPTLFGLLPGALNELYANDGGVLPTQRTVGAGNGWAPAGQVILSSPAAIATNVVVVSGAWGVMGQNMPISYQWNPDVLTQNGAYSCTVVISLAP